MKKFSGIDLHSNNCVVVVTDECDQMLYRQRLPNELPAILAAWPDDGQLLRSFGEHLCH